MVGLESTWLTIYCNDFGNCVVSNVFPYVVNHMVFKIFERKIFRRIYGSKFEYGE
jgi:hypothetical protein